MITKLFRRCSCIYFMNTFIHEMNEYASGAALRTNLC